MSILEAIFLGLVQGLTEFIPVSSSGHLLLMHEALGLQAGGLYFDVALHIGTLAALVIFFYKDLWQLALGIFGKSSQKRLAWLLVLATIPAVIAGVLLESAAESTFRSARLVAVAMMVMAGLMLLAEYVARQRDKQANLHKISRGQALAMGTAQAIALVPGVSRSGSTITAGLFVGLDRVAATRFSFLLAIPITAGAVLKVLVGGVPAGTPSYSLAVLISGIIASLVAGLFAIRFLLAYLARHSLAVFAYYRIAVGVITLLLLAR